MNEEKFEALINNDDTLRKLLIDKEISTLSSFRKDKYDDEFKEYIQERYYESFKEIYKKYYSEKTIGKVTALLRSVDVLATPEVRDAIVKGIQASLTDSFEKLTAIRESLAQNSKDFDATALKIDSALNYAVLDILNRFDSYDNIREFKVKIISSCLDICDYVSKANPKKETLKYAIYNMIINNLEKIKNFGSLRDRYEGHKSKISKKRTGIEVKYWLWIVLVAVLVILKILLRLGR